MKANSPWLLAAGLVVTALVGAVVTWGRLRQVDVPRPATWDEPVIVCPGRGVSVAELDAAVRWWREQGHDVSARCGAGWNVTLELDPELDTRASVDDLEVVHGVTDAFADGEVLVAAEVRILPGSDALVIAHEIGHALGYLHPVAAPTGHLMHPSAPGWDGRGLRGP